MRLTEKCAKCLYDRQKNRNPDEEYLSEVKRIIEERGENDTSPLLVYRFNRVYEKRFWVPALTGMLVEELGQGK